MSGGGSGCGSGRCTSGRHLLAVRRGGSPDLLELAAKQHFERGSPIEPDITAEEERCLRPGATDSDAAKDIFETGQKANVCELPGWKSSLPMLIWQSNQEPLAPACLDLREVTPEAGRHFVGIEHVALRGEDVAFRLLAARLCRREWVRGSDVPRRRPVPYQPERREHGDIGVGGESYPQLAVLNRSGDAIDGLNRSLQEGRPGRLIPEMTGGKLGRDSMDSLGRARIVSHRSLPGAVHLKCSARRVAVGDSARRPGTAL